MAYSCSNVRIPCSGCQDSCQNKWDLREIDMDEGIESDDGSENGDDDFDDSYI